MSTEPEAPEPPREPPAVATTKISVMAASIFQPWRRSPTRRPKAKHSAARIRKIATIWNRFDSGVGFS